MLSVVWADLWGRRGFISGKSTVVMYPTVCGGARIGAMQGLAQGWAVGGGEDGAVDISLPLPGSASLSDSAGLGPHVLVPTT